MISTVSRRLSLRALRFHTPITSYATSSQLSTTSSSPSSPPPTKTRLFSTTTDLPDHIVMGMPALSPTMEVGTISSWNITEGQSFSAGDSLAEIETDKATIDFEAQDDGIVAKILVEAGSAEIPVGKAIIVTVEEEEDVEAFRDFVVEEEKEVDVPVAVVVAEVVEELVVAVAVETPVSPQVTVAVTPEPVALVASAVTEGVQTLAAGSPPISPAWGNLARVRSPLASTLAKNQKKYIELYGSTGQIPL